MRFRDLRPLAQVEVLTWMITPFLRHVPKHWLSRLSAVSKSHGEPGMLVRERYCDLTTIGFHSTACEANIEACKFSNSSTSTERRRMKNCWHWHATESN